MLKGAYTEQVLVRSSSKKYEWKIIERDIFLEKSVEGGVKTLLEIGAGTGQDSRFFMDQGLDVTA